MTRCHRNDGGSMMLDRPAPGPATSGGHHHHFRLFSAFSGAAFRRRIVDAVSCGASSRYRQHKNDNAPIARQKAVTEKEKPKAAPAATATASAFSEKNTKANGKSEKLLDLLNLAEWWESEADAAATRRKVEALERLKRVVRVLQAEEREKRREAAKDVRLLAKEDSEARGTLSMLGAIPPLVGMLDFGDADDSGGDDSQIAALYALLNLAIGNDLNKGAIVKAGAVHKMLKLIESPHSLNPSVSEAIVANFLGLSALDSNKPIIGSSGAIPFLVKTLKDVDKTTSSQAKQDALRALYNLSIFSLNIPFILETDLMPFMLNTLGDMEVSDRMLSIMGNVVSTPEGRKAISAVPDSFPILVDVLNWNDSPGCQEKASYVLMVMAHKAYGDRHAMIEAGIVSALLELTLLGSTLAQKRASRILECLRVDKGKQVSESFGGNMGGAAVSAPICGTSSSAMMNPNMDPKTCLEEEEEMMSEEKKAVKQLVQQSLQNNMRKIVKRANLPQDLVPFHFKSLTASSTSKSLPF